MGTEDKDDPYRRPTTEIESDQPGETTRARTPGFLEMVLILAGSAFVGGIAFFATCLGGFVPIAFLSEYVSFAFERQEQIGILAVLGLFIGSTAVSGYVAYLTGRAIHRRFSKSQTKSDG